MSEVFMVLKEDIERRINRFKSDLSIYTSLEITRRNIIFGECACIDSDEYFRLRALIADKFKLHPNEVVLVGSAKLGFSIAPEKRYKHFSDSSDFDIAIVSQNFFDMCWRKLFSYKRQFGYWERLQDSIQYLFKGWIRPDKMPPDISFNFGKEWWEFFNAISASREFTSSTIRGGVYKDWYFLEEYHCGAIEKCKTEATLADTTDTEKE